MKNKNEVGDFHPESNAEDRDLMQLLALKSADLSHPAKPWAIHEQWSALVTEEFFRQGDVEKKEGYPVSMFMDRTSTNIPKSQVGFIQFLVKPCISSIGSWVNFEQQLQNLDENISRWQAQMPPEPEKEKQATGSAGKK